MSDEFTSNGWTQASTILIVSILLGAIVFILLLFAYSKMCEKVIHRPIHRADPPCPPQPLTFTQPQSYAQPPPFAPPPSYAEPPPFAPPSYAQSQSYPTNS